MSVDWKFAFKHFDKDSKKEISCGDGWIKLVEKMINKLSKKNVSWGISKIGKSNEGILLVHGSIYSPPENFDVEADFFGIIGNICLKSSSVCELCGDAGTIQDMKVRCSSCKGKG